METPQKTEKELTKVSQEKHKSFKELLSRRGPKAIDPGKQYYFDAGFEYGYSYASKEVALAIKEKDAEIAAKDLRNKATGGRIE